MTDEGAFISQSTYYRAFCHAAVILAVVRNVLAHYVVAGHVVVLGVYLVLIFEERRVFVQLGYLHVILVLRRKRYAVCNNLTDIFDVGS